MGWTVRSGKVVGKIGFGLAVGFSVTEFIGGPIVCRGPSMNPTIVSEDILLTEAITPRLGEIKKGDVVICLDPMDLHASHNRFVCKRVQAVQGDKVNFDGRITTVPKSHIWIEGDNKDDSTDSRIYGPVPKTLVKKRCVWKVWPVFSSLEELKEEKEIDWAQYFALKNKQK